MAASKKKASGRGARKAAKAKSSRAGRKKKPVRSKRRGPARESGRLRFLVGWGARLAVLVALAGALWAFSLSQEIIARFEGERFRLPSRVYADAVVLDEGLELAAFGLRERLERLGYDPVDARPPRTGQYWWGHSRVEIGVRAFTFADGRRPSHRVVLELADGRIESVTSPDPVEPPFGLEPEIVGGLFRGNWQERDLVTLDDVPDALVDAVLAVEDSRFLDHVGVDPIAIGRALWVDIRTGSFAQGGSTLTQQLVKNLFLTPERTLRRKVREAAMAVVLDALYPKEEILETYLNAIYLGQRGTMGVYGVGEAAHYFFGRSISDLGLAECALLAGMIQSPGRYDPFRHPERARERRDVVIGRMLVTERIDERAADRARQTGLPRRSRPGPPPGAPYFVDHLRAELRASYSEATLTGGGLSVFTTLDPVLQIRASEAIGRGLDLLERSPTVKAFESASALEAALVELDPETGSVRALVGGRSHKTSPFNRAVQARRQAGSLVKPFLYARALDGDAGRPVTLATVVPDEPYTVRYDGKEWEPANFDEEFRGPITIHEALVHSVNVPAARMGQAVGTAAFARYLETLGLDGSLPPVPSLALGTAEVTPLSVARAYAALASEGLRVTPTGVRNVVDGAGAVLTRKPPRAVRVMSADTAYLVTHALEQVMSEGTGRSSAALGLARPAAGKTGTTDDFRDAWFAGYLPGRVIVVWVGRDGNEPIGRGVTGARAALPIWVRYVEETSWWPEEGFLPPPGIVFDEVDPTTGQRTTAFCPDELRLPFVEGTEPEETCVEHPTLVERLRDGLSLDGDDDEEPVRGSDPNGEAVEAPEEEDDNWGWLNDLF